MQRRRRRGKIFDGGVTGHSVDDFDAMEIRRGKSAKFGSAGVWSYKKAVLPQGNRAMPQIFFSVEVR